MGDTGINWGGRAGRLTPGIRVRWDDPSWNTGSINVYVEFWVRSHFSFNDDQMLHIRGSIAHDHGYFLSTANVDFSEIHLYTYTISGQGVRYGGGPGYTFAMSISGSVDGNPSHSINWSLPGKPVGPPVMHTPFFNDAGTSPTQLWLHAPLKDGRGGTPNIYQYQWSGNANMSNFSSGDSAGQHRYITGLQPETRYYARTRAHTPGVGWGDWSAIISGRTHGYPGKPNAPTFSNIGPDSVKITTNTPTAGNGGTISGYLFDIASNASLTGYTRHTSKTTSVTVTGLTPGTRYWVRTAATNQYGNGPGSTFAAFDTLAGAKMWTGSQWQDIGAYEWTGSAWSPLVAQKRGANGWEI